MEGSRAHHQIDADLKDERQARERTGERTARVQGRVWMRLMGGCVGAVGGAHWSIEREMELMPLTRIRSICPLGQRASLGTPPCGNRKESGQSERSQLQSERGRGTHTGTTRSRYDRGGLVWNEAVKCCKEKAPACRMFGQEEFIIALSTRGAHAGHPSTATPFSSTAAPA